MIDSYELYPRSSSSLPYRAPVSRPIDKKKWEEYASSYFQPLSEDEPDADEKHDFVKKSYLFLPR